MKTTVQVLEPFLPLPEKLASSFCGSINFMGKSRLGGIILEVKDIMHGDAILKIGKSRCAEDLRDEAAWIRLLSGFLPVPDVLYFGEENECAFLLLTKLPGVPGHLANSIYTIDDIIQRYANNLYRIHKLKIERKSLPQAVNKIFSYAAKLVEKDKIDSHNLEKSTGMNPIQLLNYIEKNMDRAQGDVFTHGDYCLPNMMLHEDKTFIIDWGQAALSNVNRDFMCVELSISMNFGEKYIKRFYEYYKGDTPNPELIKFYWLCEQFEKYETE